MTYVTKLYVLVLALVLVPSLACASTTVISFEAAEGFPTCSSTTWGSAIADGLAVPAGIVSEWAIAGISGSHWYLGTPGDGGFEWSTVSAPVSGVQIAVVGAAGNGDVTGTMDLVNSANLTLNSFYWAWRGNGSGVLEVSYYDTNEMLLGTDTFTGGIGSLWEAVFQINNPSAEYQGVALSKVDFKGIAPPDGSATFLMDDITLSTVEAPVVPEPSSLAMLLVGGLGTLAFIRRRSA